MGDSRVVEEITLYTLSGKAYHPTIKQLAGFAKIIYMQSAARRRLEEKIRVLEEENMALAQLLEERRRLTARIIGRLRSARRKILEQSSQLQESESVLVDDKDQHDA
jgi:transcriptional regulator with GAF, ATPase, and Fis domain